jgi:hypothetical protein
MNIRRFLTAVAVLAGAVVLSHSVAFAQATVPPSFAVLLGGNEVSNTGDANAGDPDGHGSATVIIRGTTLCFAILVNGIDRPTAAHIHQGAAGTNGPVVVTLTAPSTGNPGTSSGCITGVRAAPGAFYVNVHTARFPNGAIRGQLF